MKRFLFLSVLFFCVLRSNGQCDIKASVDSVLNSKGYDTLWDYPGFLSPKTPQGNFVCKQTDTIWIFSFPIIPNVDSVKWSLSSLSTSDINKIKKSSQTYKNDTSYFFKININTERAPKLIVKFKNDCDSLILFTDEAPFIDGISYKTFISRHEFCPFDNFPNVYAKKRNDAVGDWYLNGRLIRDDSDYLPSSDFTIDDFETNDTLMLIINQNMWNLPCPFPDTTSVIIKLKEPAKINYTLDVNKTHDYHIGDTLRFELKDVTASVDTFSITVWDQEILSKFEHVVMGNTNIPFIITPSKCGETVHQTIPIRISKENISGYVYEDLNNNCQFDSSDAPLANRLIQFQPSKRYGYTNEDGYYSTEVFVGINTVSLAKHKFDSSFCQADTFTFSVSNTKENRLDFGVRKKYVSDIFLRKLDARARPGFVFKYNLSAYNKGNVSGHAFVKILPDPILSLEESNEDYQSGDTLIWEITDLEPKIYYPIMIKTKVPADVTLLGQWLESYAWLETANKEDSLYLMTEITGAYDPNDKLVNPDRGILRSENDLNYTIRFQNTGTDTAFNVRIVDTLSANYNIGSFNMVDASHPYELEIQPGNVFVWYFDNILLPDSNVNEPASNGYLSFNIKKDTSLAIGDSVTNKAAIYFDFNPPIITNDATSKIVRVIVKPKPVGFSEVVENPVNIYPNPSDNIIHVDYLLNESYSVSIYNSMGVLKQRLNNQQGEVVFDTSDWAKGAYFYELITKDNKRVNGKIILN